MNEVALILGGTRSGKSRHAEALVAATGRRKTYVATAQAFDDEMRDRIALHQARRAGEGWHTIEAPLALASALQAQRGSGDAVLVDCLTLWLSNLLIAGESVEQGCETLLGAIAAADHPLIMVSNEVGLGIVPDNALARAFRDHAGMLHQNIARLAKTVHFVAAGLPITLKG